MKPVSLSDLETHLVSMHKVDPKLVILLEENHADKRQEVAATSHALMHMSGLSEETTPHTHPEFEKVGDDDGTVRDE